MLKLSSRFFVVQAALLVLLGVSCKQNATFLQADNPMQAGWNNYSLGEFDRAEFYFEQAIAQAPAGSDEQLSALYGLATTLNLRRPGEDPERAREMYEQIIKASPTNDLAAWSMLALARMKHLVPVGQDPDYDQVYKAYQEVIDRYPDHLAAKEAFLYLNSILIATLKEPETRKALAALEEYVKNPSNTFLGPCWSLIAVGNTTLGNQQRRFEAEVKSFENTEIDPTNPFTEFAWAYWNLATIAEFELGDFETARLYYRKLIAEYPKDQKVYGAKQALKRMDAMEAKIREELKNTGNP
jgi:tetratricopeptide (TPR) repeat protein